MRSRFPALALRCCGRWPRPSHAVAPLAAAGRAARAEPPTKLPHAQRGDRTRNLDFLFGALKAAPDDDSAKAVENRIWALWLASGSDTANLLMTRVQDRDRGQGSRSRASSCSTPSSRSSRTTSRPGTGAPPSITCEGVRPGAGRHPRGAEARAAPFRRAVRARHDPAGVRRREARARSLPPRARGQSAPRADSRSLVKTLTEKVEGRDI